MLGTWELFKVQINQRQPKEIHTISLHFREERLSMIFRKLLNLISQKLFKSTSKHFAHTYPHFAAVYIHSLTANPQAR